MRRSLTLVGWIALVFFALVPGADARPWLEVETRSGAPETLANPGGTFEARCWVHDAGGAATSLDLSITDADGNLVHHETQRGSEYQDFRWTVPPGIPDGLYRYMIRVVGGAGPLSSSEGDVILGGITSGLCAYKYIDLNRNGLYDVGIDELATGWEICVVGRGCKITGAGFTVCWFFLPIGEYTICETQQPGYTPTTDPCQTIQIEPREIAKIGFGNAIIPPDGACCFPDGHCAVMTEEECLAGGGDYFGDETECVPNPCPQPTGACCFPDGHCTVATAAECGAEGGTYYGDGTDCDPNPCTQPAGGCCYPDGHCTISTETECLAGGGIYQGTGTGCDPNPCPQPTGACCFPDGHCAVVTSAECRDAGGTYYGDATDCDPNPCTQPMGACCFPDGTCDIATETDCASAGGIYQGTGTDCDPNPCTVPTGACCLEDGTCEVMTRAECKAASGVYRGDGKPCDQQACPPLGTEPTTWGRLKHQMHP